MTKKQLEKKVANQRCYYKGKVKELKVYKKNYYVLLRNQNWLMVVTTLTAVVATLVIWKATK